MVECSGQSRGSEKDLTRSQYVHYKPHTDCPWRNPGLHDVKFGLKLVPPPRGRLIIWRPFESIFLKLFSAYNRAGEYF
jgi:hypothetical protein